MAVLRGMVKSRRESVALYTQGARPELAAKEEAEIAVIEGFLPAADGRGGGGRRRRCGRHRVETGAAGPKDMGRVMAAAEGEARRGARTSAARPRRW